MLPPDSVWVQFTIIAVFILMLAAAATAFWKLWHELLGWLDSQDKKRDAEREKQRAWESEQAKIRDERWQATIQDIVTGWQLQGQQTTKALEEMGERLEALAIAFTNHDTWVRASNPPNRRNGDS